MTPLEIAEQLSVRLARLRNMRSTTAPAGKASNGGVIAIETNLIEAAIAALTEKSSNEQEQPVADA